MVVFGIVFFIALGLVGRMDMEDEIREQMKYCEMVGGNHWPDYKSQYKDCDKTRAAYDKYVSK